MPGPQELAFGAETSGSLSESFWLRTMGAPALFPSPDADSPLMRAGKPIGILAYLALAPGRKADRDRVAELFWTDADLADARHSLRQALYRLKRATTGHELVCHDNGTLQLAECVRVDCLEGEEAAANGDLDRAAALLMGTFLGGLSVSESHEYEEWAETQRSRFRQAWASSATASARAALTRGDTGRALEVAEELASRLPYDDGPVLLLMQTLATTGRHAMALARYAGHVELLREEDDEPDSELVRYAEELRRFVQEREASEAELLPFVGRSAEWRQLETAWAGAERRRSSVWLIEGDAGLGKTRVLEELHRRAEAAKGIVLSSKCYEPEKTVPYGAIADALAQAVDDDGIEELDSAWLAEAARLLPEIRERFPDLPTAPAGEGSLASKRRLQQSVVRLVEALARARPVLLALDDVHWADASTLEMLHFLCHHLRDQGVMTVASYRPLELSPAARSVARSLVSENLAGVVHLGPLDLDDVADLLARRARFTEKESASSLARILYERSGGSPLLISEFLEALAHRGQLFVKAGTWTWGGEKTLAALPRTIGRLLADRIERLTPWMRTCVEVMAVAADEVPIDVLARTVNISEPRAELALTVLQEERLARRTAPGAFDLIHDELRRHVAQGIPDERRRALHHSLGRVLESMGNARHPGGAARLVYHFDQAGAVQLARKYALLAAGEASALSASDAVQAHLDVAAAHAPRPLPLTRTSSHPSRFWRSLAALAAVTAAVGTIGFLAVRTLGPRQAGPGVAVNPADYRIGTILLAERGSGGPTHRLLWPDSIGGEGALERLESSPEGFPPNIVLRPLSDEEGTHDKLFLVQDGDTVQLTFGHSDDMGGSWSPDGRLVLYSEGRRVDATRYITRLRLLDPQTGVLRTITPGYQDTGPGWSPSGTRIVFNRQYADATGHAIWLVDADGGFPTNLTERFQLPHTLGRAAFAPDGHRVVISYRREGTLWIVDPDDGFKREISVGVHEATDPFWSPDGQWIGYRASARADSGLYVIRVEGGGGPHRIASVPGSFKPGPWIRGDDGQSPAPTYVDRVSIESPDIPLFTYRGTSVMAQVLDPSGRPLDARLRWSTMDTSVATVDDRGFVRGRRGGVTNLVASAGGFRADTVPVRVTYAPLDTLFVEDWKAGLDLELWKPFGIPPPLVVDAAFPGKPVFFNSGDYNHASGAQITRAFQVDDAGLTVEAEAFFRFTGQHWEYWELRIAPALAELSLEGDWVQRPGDGITAWGPEPTRPQASVSCDEPYVPEEEIQGRWITLALQIRPDGYLECYLDGRLFDRVPSALAHLGREVYVFLAGAAEHTRLYHGDVIVTRGLRY